MLHQEKVFRPGQMLPISQGWDALVRLSHSLWDVKQMGIGNVEKEGPYSRGDEKGGGYGKQVCLTLKLLELSFWHKHEDQSLEAQDSGRKSGVVSCTCNPSTGEADRRISGISWPASLDESVGSTFTEGHHLKK